MEKKNYGKSVKTRLLNLMNETGYKYMYFIPRDKQDPITFKYIARRNLHERGYNVAMSIGDMPWDIGYYGGIGFQVPK